MNGISDSALRLFQDEFQQLSALVQKRVEVEWRYHRGLAFSSALPFLLEYTHEFGLLLRVIYRYGLFGALREEATWYASVFAARGHGHDLFAVLLESWIIAIQGTIKPPECHELTSALQSLREDLDSLVEASSERRDSAPSTVSPALMESLCRGDTRRTREVIRALLNSWRLPERLIVEELLPAMGEIGRRWELNDMEIFEEHLATEAVRGALSALPAMVNQQPSMSHPNAVVSCVPGDEHELIPLALAAYLEIRGWSVKNLGGSLPADQIARAVSAFSPEVLFLSLTLLSRLDQALEVMERVHSQAGRCRVIFGGHGAFMARDILQQHGALVARDFDEGYSLAIGGPQDA